MAVRLSAYARGLMSIGAAAIFVGAGIMAHGEMNFGDGVLIAGIVLFLAGVAALANSPTGDHDAG